MPACVGGAQDTPQRHRQGSRQVRPGVTDALLTIAAFVCGDRDGAACRAFWERVPEDCRECRSFSDFWKAYAAVLPEGIHRCAGKEAGETARMERWYNTLRQRTERFARKTPSFSKKQR